MYNDLAEYFSWPASQGPDRILPFLCAYTGKRFFVWKVISNQAKNCYLKPMLLGAVNQHFHGTQLTDRCASPHNGLSSTFSTTHTPIEGLSHTPQLCQNTECIKYSCSPTNRAVCATQPPTSTYEFVVVAHCLEDPLC